MGTVIALEPPFPIRHGDMTRLFHLPGHSNWPWAERYVTDQGPSDSLERADHRGWTISWKKRGAAYRAGGTSLRTRCQRGKQSKTREERSLRIPFWSPVTTAARPLWGLLGSRTDEPFCMWLLEGFSVPSQPKTVLIKQKFGKLNNQFTNQSINHRVMY